MPLPTAMHRLLIIHQGAVGDLILSLPALHAIRTAYPLHHIEVLGYPRILCLVHQRFYADTVASIERAMFASLYGDEPPADPSLRAYFNGFDPVFIFGGRMQEAAVANIRRMTNGKVFAVRPFPETERLHVSDFQVQQLCGWGIAPSAAQPILFPSEDDAAEGSRLLHSLGLQTRGRAVMAVHPGSGSSRKNWPAECFADLIRTVAQQRACEIMLIAGPADDEPCRQVEQRLAGMRTAIVRHPELSVLAGLLKQCSLYVGNDSGVTHLAAAVGVPTIATFGPTDPAVWGPRGRRVRILNGSHDGKTWTWPTVDEVARTVSELFREIHC